MASTKTPNPTPVTPRRDFIILLACLLVVLGALFHKSFLPGQVVFNNEGPPGVNVAAQTKLPERFAGLWMDSNWHGTDGGSMPTDLQKWLLG